jgi:hypothetical protein
VPTKHERIAVTKDEELAEALDRVAGLVPADVPQSKLVHDLAVRGAESLRDEQERRRELLDEFADRLASGDPPWDPAVLARVDELAWRMR